MVFNLLVFNKTVFSNVGVINSHSVRFVHIYSKQNNDMKGQHERSEQHEQFQQDKNNLNTQLFVYSPQPEQTSLRQTSHG